MRTLLIVDEATLGREDAMALMRVAGDGVQTMMVDSSQEGTVERQLTHIRPVLERALGQIGVATAGPRVPLVFLSERGGLEPLMASECHVHFIASGVAPNDASMHAFARYVGRARSVFVSSGRMGNVWTGGSWVAQRLSDASTTVRLDQIYLDPGTVQRVRSTFFMARRPGCRGQ